VIVVVLLLLILAMGAWAAIAPLSLWRVTQGRLYDDRASVRPTSTALLGQRVLGAVVAVVALVTLIRL
jgi:hypothetical protein